MKRSSHEKGGESTMQSLRFRKVALVAAIACASAGSLWARDGRRINLPARGKLTPVQRLNREGVEQIKKNNYEGAEALFYKAYLYDPADPFTLNNLGYVAELEGQIDRARTFYHLASEQSSDANIDRSNVSHLEGRVMKDALVNLQDAPMRVNRMNIDAMRLLAQERGFDAVALLRQALALDPRNPFTLNNLGVANEATGDYESAMRFYQAAAATGASEPASISMDRTWKGKSVSEMASASARRLERRTQDIGSRESRAVMLTMRGVFEINQSDWPAAREDFLQAYALDPSSAFCLNNRAYVAERDGDLETAQHFYMKAQQADNAGATVGLSTDRSFTGMRLGAVAKDSDGKVGAALEDYSRRRREQKGPVKLTPRGGASNETAPAENPPAGPASTPPPQPPQ
jgi:Flp pilus assembly protein TadD